MAISMQHGHGGRVLQRGGSLSKLSGTVIVTSSLGDLTQYLGSSPSTGSKRVTSYSPIQAGRPIRLAQTVTASPSANLWVAIPCSLGAPCCAPYEPPIVACSCRFPLRSAVALLVRSARSARARRSAWRQAHLGLRPGGTYHRRFTRQVFAERKGILWLKVPPSTVCKQERLAHRDDLIRRAGLVLQSVINSPRGDRDQPSSV